MGDYVTDIEVRQKGVSHDVAFQNVLDAAALLMDAGYDVKLRPTLPDEDAAKTSTTWTDEDGAVHVLGCDGYGCDGCVGEDEDEDEADAPR